MKLVLLVTLICSMLDHAWSIRDDEDVVYSGWSISDEDLMRIKAGLNQIQNLTREVQDLRNENEDLRKRQSQIQVLTEEVLELRNESQAAQMEIQAVTRKVDILGKENLDLLSFKTKIQAMWTRRESLRSDSESMPWNVDGMLMDARLTTAETQIEDLLAMNAELVATMKVTAREAVENKTTIAFHAMISNSYDGSHIPLGSIVKFTDVPLNQGRGYDPITGVFEVPPGEGGYYYFSSQYSLTGNLAHIDLRVNDQILCTVYEQKHNGGCNIVVLLEEGDTVKNVNRKGSSNLLVEYDFGVYNGFSGFKL